MGGTHVGNVARKMAWVDITASPNNTQDNPLSKLFQGQITCSFLVCLMPLYAIKQFLLL